MHQLPKDQAPKVGSWSYDLLTGEQIWSKGHYAIFEIEAPQTKENLYRLYRERIHPQDLLVLDSLIATALSNKESFLFDHRVLLDGGRRVKFVQGIAEVEVDEAGAPVLIRGTCRERSDEVEYELKQKIILDTLSEGVVIHNSEGVIIQFNPSALSILELTADQFLGRTSLDPDWKTVREDGSEFPGTEHPAVLALQSGHKIQNVTMGVKTNKSDIKWVLINATPMETQTGRVAIVTFVDMTALTQSTKEIRFVLDTIGIGIWKANLATREQTWDPSMYKLYEINQSDFKSDYEAWESFLSEDSKAKAQEDWKKILEGQDDIESEYEILTKSGKTKHIRGAGKVVRSATGEPIMLYGVNWDRSKEVELERKLQVERANVFHKAKLATIGELASGVAHEINNPLAIVKGYLEIAKSILTDEEFKNQALTTNFNQIGLAVDRIAGIVARLVQFAKSDNLNVLQFDPDLLVREIIEIVKTIYASQKVTISYVGPGTTVSYLGNRNRIEQALINLISNAKEASKGKPNRTISIAVAIKGEMLRISVSDNGEGIPLELRSKVFDPFFTTKELNLGRGLGLSLAETIVKEHGGQIEVESTVGSGSIFTIVLPIKP